MHNEKNFREVIRENSEEEEGSMEEMDAESAGLFGNGGSVLYFSLKHQVEFGKCVYVTGSIPALGNWCPNKAIRLTWTDGHQWISHLQLRNCKKQFNLKYKYFVSDFEMTPDSSIEWEPGSNRTLITTLEDLLMTSLEDVWAFVKIVFRFAIDESIYSVYIAGHLFMLGYSESNPGRMFLRVVRDYGSTRIFHFWEKEILIPCDIDKVEYKYGIRERKNSMIRWERESERVLNLKDIKYSIDEQFDMFRENLGVHSSTTSFTFKFGYYVRMDHSFIDDFIYSEISDSLWIGPYPKYEELERLHQKGCNCVLSLQTKQELEGLLVSYEMYQENSSKYGLKYFLSPVNLTFPLDPKQILAAASMLSNCINSFKCVYLHCSDGLLRSVATAIIFYHIFMGYPVKQAIDIVKGKRWRSKVDENLINDLLKTIKPETSIPFVRKGSLK